MKITYSPLVSVVIPFYNRPNETIRAIESVTSQEYSNYEIILVNDGSTDNIDLVTNFCKDLKNVRILNQKNEGPGSARNYGISESKGMYVALLDSDDIWLPNKLVNQINYMIENNFYFSHTSYEIINETQSKNIIIDSGIKNYKFPMLAFHNKIATPTVVFKKSLISNNEIDFIKKYRRGEDTILWLYISKKTILWGFPEILTKVYQGKETSALNNKNNRIGFNSINESLSDYKFIQFVHKLYIYLRVFVRSI